MFRESPRRVNPEGDFRDLDEDGDILSMASEEKSSGIIDKIIPDYISADFDIAIQMAEEILKTDLDDEERDSLEKTIEAINDMYIWCDRYAATVAEFKRLALISGNNPGSRAEFARVNNRRGGVHDAVMKAIDRVNFLMRINHMDVEWVDKYELHDHEKNRPSYGKFAVYLALKRKLEKLEQTEQTEEVE